MMNRLTNASAAPEADPQRILLVAPPGLATSQIEAALAQRGHDVARVSPDDPDLFAHAVGCGAIVFSPERSLLSARLAPAPGAHEHVADVLRAAGAPGVQLLVAVLADGPGFDAAREAIERRGRPYVILRAPGLLEDVSEALRSDAGTLWLPRAGEVHVCRGGALSDAVAEALVTERQGCVVAVPGETFDVARLFATASELAGGQVRVRPVAPLMFRLVRPVARWLRAGEPPPLSLADRLLGAGGTASAS